MGWEKPKPDKIIGKLHEAEIMLAQGETVPDARRRLGARCTLLSSWA
ncbi:hypothetical protein EDF56_11443 [Novosphingobium sp. PhB165]|nr:hypothetical protein EDF56_11443 [Novosphingobium sp. PhB165]